jgi:DNA (cytosine-5)-methyltransferase 1
LFDNHSAIQKAFSIMRVCDLFAGIGGIRLAFEVEGCTTVFASEIDKFARQTYSVNFGTEPFGDITKIQEYDIPEFDILTAGFPCQPFSIAGKRLGFDDARGTLFYDIARIVSYHRPRAFLLENVKGFKNHNGGETLNIVIGILTELGYSVSHEVLNTRDFGLPQNRERIYIVGFLGDNVDFRFPIPPRTKTKVAQILESSVDLKYHKSSIAWTGMANRLDKNKSKGNGFSYGLYDAQSQHTATLCANYHKDGNDILISVFGRYPRRLTPRECANLQGFPTSFLLPCSDTQTYKQLGNSVSVPVVNAIAKEIIKCLENIS